MPNIPPKWSQRFLHWFCKSELLEEIEGDLNEEFGERLERLGIKKARWFFVWQVFSFFRPYAIKSFDLPFYHFIPMYFHYLKIAYRNLCKQKVTGLIKTIGLSIGLATCLLILMYVNYELDFDKFHEKPEEIYRLTFKTILENGVEDNSSFVPMGMLPDIMNQAAEIETATSFNCRGATIGLEDQIFQSIAAINADSNFFKIFHFPLLSGERPLFPHTQHEVLITERLAERLFGQADPLNKLLNIYHWRDTATYTITGILQNPPGQSHVDFDLVYPKKHRKWTYSWNAHTFSDLSYVRLYDQILLPDFQQSLDTFVTTTGGDLTKKQINTQALLDIHLKSHLNYELGVNGNIRDIYLFSGIALLILCIALINYILTVTADFTRRIKEIGIRKTSGALSKDIVRQFFTETFLYILMAVPLLGILVYLSLPAFSELVNRPIGFDLLVNQWSILLLALGIIMVLFTAAIYPAWILARMTTVDSLKGEFLKVSSGHGLRKILLTSQFVITLSLIASLGIIYRQTHFISTMDLGFERDNKLVLQIGYGNAHTAQLKQKILQSPDVQAATVTSWVPAKSIMGSGSLTHPKTNEPIQVFWLTADEDMLETYGLKLTSGRNYGPQTIGKNDSFHKGIDVANLEQVQKNTIVNECFIKTMGLDTEIGTQFKYPFGKGILLGIVADFNVKDIYEPIKPTVYNYSDKANYLVISYLAGKDKEVLAHAQEVWHQYALQGSLHYFFLNDHLDQIYDKEDRLLSMIILFSCLAIGLACLGVFGLSAITAERRSKEIGIRKVLGASISHIIWLLNKDFVKLIFIATLMAIPISSYFMGEWLQQFAYKIDIQPTEYLLAGLIVLSIVTLTVSLRSLAISLANPVEALRQE